MATMCMCVFVLKSLVDAAIWVNMKGRNIISETTYLRDWHEIWGRGTMKRWRERDELVVVLTGGKEWNGEEEERDMCLSLFNPEPLQGMGNHRSIIIWKYLNGASDGLNWNQNVISFSFCSSSHHLSSYFWFLPAFKEEPENNNSILRRWSRYWK